jgi:nitrate reductase alpha subunit
MPLAMAMGHVALNEFYFKQAQQYFDDYARRYTDLPLLVMLKEHTLPDGSKTLVPDRYLRASDFNGKLGQENNPEWKTVAFDTERPRGAAQRLHRLPLGPEGGVDQGKWNLESKEARHGTDVKLKLSVIEDGEQAMRWSTSACRTSVA